MIILKRLPEYGSGTPGVITIDNVLLCHTLERPWLDNQHDISCIPTGTYSVTYNYSPHLEKLTWELLDVPGRTNIRIHPANLIGELLGCIAPCESITINNGSLFGANSRRACEALSLVLDNYKSITII